jgi:hypothetical protein
MPGHFGFEELIPSIERFAFCWVMWRTLDFFNLKRFSEVGTYEIVTFDGSLERL